MIAGIIKGYAPPKEFAESLGSAENKYNEFMKRVSVQPVAGALPGDFSVLLQWGQ